MRLPGDGWQLSTSVDATLEDRLTTHLVEYNRASSAAIRERFHGANLAAEPVHAFVLGSGGVLLGGCTGRVERVWHWLDVDTMWVDEAVRGRGIGLAGTPTTTCARTSDARGRAAHNEVMDRAAVERWVADYERLWRTPGTDRLAELFAPDASYLPSPWARPVAGLEALARFWDAERAGPDEEFTMSSDVVAVDGETAVVRVFVEYGAPRGQSWRDLWVLRFAQDGRCASFEEWPFAPDRPDGHQT